MPLHGMHGSGVNRRSAQAFARHVCIRCKNRGQNGSDHALVPRLVHPVQGRWPADKIGPRVGWSLGGALPDGGVPEVHARVA